MEKKFPEKSPITSENAWFTMKKVLFLCFSFPMIYFLQNFFSCDLISWDFIGSPHTLLGKNVPGIQNTWLYFQWPFFQGLEKILTFFPKFLFPGFFPETFSPGTFLHRFWKCTVYINCTSPMFRCLEVNSIHKLYKFYV